MFLALPFRSQKTKKSTANFLLLISNALKYLQGSQGDYYKDHRQISYLILSDLEFHSSLNHQKTIGFPFPLFFLFACLFLSHFKARNRVGPIPANIDLFKVHNRKTSKRCEICSKLTIETPERRH